MSNATLTPKASKPTVHDTTAREIVNYVDNLGSGLSTEHEARLTKWIAALLAKTYSK